MRVLILAGFLAIAGLIGVRWPVRTFTLVIFALLNLPWVSSLALFGTGTLEGVEYVHPAVWVLLGLSIGIVAKDVTRTAAAWRESRMPMLLVGIAIALAVAQTAAMRETSNVVVVCAVIVIPVVAYFAATVLNARRPELRLAVVHTVLISGVIQSLIALAQTTFRGFYVFEDQYRTNYWWAEQLRLGRSMGTTDHPLMLAFLLCVCIPLSMTARSTLLRIGLPFLYLSGVAASGSRVGLIMGALLLMLAILGGRGGVFTRFILASGAVYAATQVVDGSLASSTLSRFRDDAGSASAREAAVDIFMRSWTGALLLGGGQGFSQEVARNNGLRTSFESPFLIYVLDFGLVATCFLFLAMLWLSLRSLRAVPLGYSLSFAAAFVFFMSYSGGAALTSAAYLLWITAMICMRHTSPAESTPHGLEHLRPVMGAQATSREYYFAGRRKP